MAEKMRYNKIIDLLEHGKPVFSTSTVPNGSLDDLTYIADADYDAVIIEMEHEGFSFTTLRTSLQVLLNRKRIAEKGNLQPDVVPMVRIPPNARERNQWVIKQALDTGVYGLVLPHLNTVEDAQAAVAAARYPQVPGVQDFAVAARLRNRLALTRFEYKDPVIVAVMVLTARRELAASGVRERRAAHVDKFTRSRIVPARHRDAGK